MAITERTQWTEFASPSIQPVQALISSVGNVAPVGSGGTYVGEWDIGSAPSLGINPNEPISFSAFNDYLNLNPVPNVRASVEFFYKLNIVGTPNDNRAIAAMFLRAELSSGASYSGFIAPNVQAGLYQWFFGRNTTSGPVTVIASGLYTPPSTFDYELPTGIRFFVDDINGTDTRLLMQININEAGWVTIGDFTDLASPIHGVAGDTFGYFVGTQTGHVFAAGQKIWMDNIEFGQNPIP